MSDDRRRSDRGSTNRATHKSEQSFFGKNTSTTPFLTYVSMVFSIMFF